jgi:hypothetical protein
VSSITVTRALLCLVLVGCAHVAPPPRIGAPPPSPEVVASCETKLSERTIMSFLGIGAGAGASFSGTAAGAEPSSNASGKLGFQIAAGGFGLVGAGVAIAVAAVNNAYNRAHCDATLAAVPSPVAPTAP